MKSPLILILCAFLASCGERGFPEKKGLNLDEEATPEQTLLIENELNQLENDFKSVGVNVNLHEVPVRVKKLEGNSWGACYQDNQRGPLAIVLDPRAFKQNGLLSKDPYLSYLTTILLHEIGHCYFDRKHIELEFLDVKQKEIVISAPGEERFATSSIPTSVMSPAAPPGPKRLRKYYVSEVAGIAKLKTLDALQSYANFEILNREVP